MNKNQLMYALTKHNEKWKQTTLEKVICCTLPKAFVCVIGLFFTEEKDDDSGFYSNFFSCLFLEGDQQTTMTWIL